MARWKDFLKVAYIYGPPNLEKPLKKVAFQDSLGPYGMQIYKSNILQREPLILRKSYILIREVV